MIQDSQLRLFLAAVIIIFALWQGSLSLEALLMLLAGILFPTTAASSTLKEVACNGKGK